MSVPKIPHAFFRWYCKKERYEEIHGDLEEFFYERADRYGLTKARLRYVMDVIRCCQPYAWKQPKTQNTTIVMFSNYYKTSFRSLMKNPLTSFINLFGLSVAIGICLVVYSFMEYQYSVDSFHQNRHEVYLATFYADRDGARQQFGLTPRPLGDMLREDFTHIKKVCRLEDKKVVLKHGDQVFHEKVRFSDPEFLEMFTFPLKWGSARSLTDLNSIILSEEMSVKYFGQDDPVGEDMLMIFGKNRNKVFKVTGVAAAFPKAHDIDFDFLINFRNLQVYNPHYDFDDWSALVNATLIQVDDPSDLKPIANGMNKYRLLQNEAEKDQPISSFAFEPLSTLYERSENIRDAISYNFSAPGRITLPILAIFMIALACFNYINIAIVSAAKRLKEIGMRKVMGANRGKVVIQFLAENIFVTLFALLVGFLLAVTIFLPWFKGISEFDLELSMIDLKLWVFLGFILLFTGVASGIYPAFYISRFQATTIFKGTVQFGKKNPLTKVFLSIQLVMACILITGAVMFTQNTAYQSHRSWGYDQKGVLYVNLPDSSAFERLKTPLLQNPNVLAIAGSSHHLGSNITSAVVHMVDRQYEVDQLSVDAHYFETMGLQLSSGRAFRDQYESDRQAVVVNGLFVKNMTLKQPVGQRFEIDGIRYEIIGVVKDFHIYNFNHEVKPTIFRLASENDYRYLSMKVQPGVEKEMYEELQQQWTSLFPEIPFEGGHQTDLWAGFFEDIDVQQRFMSTVAIIAVLLAGLGLYGLVTLNVSGRIREFSIRKVLGAGLKNIVANITRQYMLLVLMALVAGAPLSYVLITALLNMLFAYPMPLDYSGVALSVIILVIVLLAVVSTQVRKVVGSNPADGLKAE